METKLFELNDKLENIVARNYDYIGDIASDLKFEFAIDSTENLKETLKKISIQERLVKIGVVGRVKSGKSSLLNSLFFDGKSILPKAATPMTAALTVLSYGETFQAEVEFYDQKDIDQIKREHDLYLNKFDILVKDKFEHLKARNRKGLSELELKEKAKNAAKRDLINEIRLSASYDQYEKMLASGNIGKIKTEVQTIEARNQEELKELAYEYVGADGKFMPFTKSIHIRIPQPELKDIEVVDTPGINDPVVSREERTRKLLKLCDVILIVSPAGQFLSSEDKSLMDRITSKEGVNELYVVASQTDTQIFGDEKEKNNSCLPQVLKSIDKLLQEQLAATIETIKQDNPEIGSNFDELLKPERLIITSGISQAMKLNFDNRDAWDDGMTHVWGNLKEDYPDYFSDNDKNTSLHSLNEMANIDIIAQRIREIAAKKEEILAEKKEKFLKDKTTAMLQYHAKLIQEVTKKIDILNTANIDALLKQKNEIQKNKDALDIGFQEVLLEKFDALKDAVNEVVYGYLSEQKKEFRYGLRAAEGTRIKTWEVEADGIVNWGKRKLGIGGYETRSRSIKTLKTSYIVEALEDINDTLQMECLNKLNEHYKRFKKALLPEILNVIQKNDGEKILDIELLSLAIKKMIIQLRGFEIEEYTIPSSLKGRGEIEGGKSEARISIFDMEAMENDKCDSYMNEARRTAEYMFDVYKDRVKEALDELENYLTKTNPLNKVTDKITERLNTLIKEIENKKMTLEIMERAKKELSEVK